MQSETTGWCWKTRCSGFTAGESMMQETLHTARARQRMPIFQIKHMGQIFKMNTAVYLYNMDKVLKRLMKMKVLKLTIIVLLELFCTRLHSKNRHSKRATDWPKWQSPEFLPHQQSFDQRLTVTVQLRERNRSLI